MKYLNIDPLFEPFGKGIDFESFTFKGGEPHIHIREKLSASDAVTITCRARSFEQFGLVLLAADALRRFGIDHLELFIPYFPAARQDRVMVPGEPLSVKVYADLVNAAAFRRVYLFDVHSEVAPALLNNCVVIPNYTLVKKALKGHPDYILISPDGGALKKIYKLSEALGGQPVTECSKRRDVRTGKLSDFMVYTDDLQGKTCVVVDDICDGGGTFIGLAEQLKAKNAGKLILIVSHGIFSKGAGTLRSIYDEIYCSDSFLPEDIEGVTRIRFSEGLTA
ncbi:MAG: ribose-phosphate pyrophosphokinase [Bacteroidia bacterium]|nr:ribose-phosphate pyrophosphokinase [Bacteroidia bacterium]